VLDLLTDPSAWLSFLTLTGIEIVLGIDNVLFLSILVGRLPPERQRSARTMGLSLAMLTRIALLLSISWLISLTAPLVTLGGKSLSGRDLILLAGGLFLLWKSVSEIHSTVEQDDAEPATRGASKVLTVILQIALIDIVFSFDSVFTAVGLAQHIEVMVAAIIASVLVMMFVAGAIAAFIERHPTLKVLALAFLILIGVALIADAFGMHIPRGYLYFSMAFAVAVEMVNMRGRRRRTTRPSADQEPR
jgi:predicted tellurium resistance membrane protein TerC